MSDFTDISELILLICNFKLIPHCNESSVFTVSASFENSIHSEGLDFSFDFDDKKQLNRDFNTLLERGVRLHLRGFNLIKFTKVRSCNIGITRVVMVVKRIDNEYL